MKLRRHWMRDYLILEDAIVTLSNSVKLDVEQQRTIARNALKKVTDSYIEITKKVDCEDD